ncbi:MAG TPA: hypothetical protein VLD19_03975, partial [Chitinophagaceae bacterium]|nr:hypothetical protein [Chitinophagaceae bacterium]
VNPPNPSLRWEKINITNIGADFATKHNTVSGSIEYYLRRGIDLIGYSPLDPTTGIPSFKGNTADMKGRGLDVIINTKNNDKAPVHWYTAFLFSYTTDEVTSYKVKQSSIGSYYNQTMFNPLPGKPLYSVYMLKWAGLDPQTGYPQGMLDGHVSQDYASILNSGDFNNLIYKGTANPRFFGSFRNTVAWKQLELSFMLTWKMGYYFRRSSISYSELYNGNSKGHLDFERRWQKPGDEKTTDIPSMVYPVDPLRDAFYNYSSVLVERGDHIRLQDIRLGYELKKERQKNLPVRSMQFYLYVNNIGLLWRANNKGIDPDYFNSIPNPRSLSAGVKVDF